MKKSVVLTVLIAAMAVMAYSLDINDPADRIYDDIEVWQEKGYYGHIPEIRPYPAQLLLELLDRVIAKGEYQDKQIAQKYREEIDKPLNISVEAEAETRYGRGELGETNGTLDFEINGVINDYVSLWGNVSANAIIGYEEPDYYMYYDTLPYGERSDENWVSDTGTIFGLSLFSGNASMLSLGTSTLYGNFGLTRSSFGPFYDDGVVLSEEADEQGHFEITWRGDNFSYSTLFLTLVGTDYNGDSEFSEKYLAMHSYNWSPYQWLDIGFFETNVWGGRLEPLYLLPFSYLFYSQGVSGFADNSLMGLKLRALAPQQRVEFNGILYVDDVGFNDVVKFDFDTKMKIAVEAGSSWTPDRSWLHKISLDYTAVFPYMYTHYPWVWNGGTAFNETQTNGTIDTADDYPFYETMNADNYTHNGACLGTTLSPNSDRTTLKGKWRLDDDTMVTAFTQFFRHGNASEDQSYSDANGDGSIWDNGNDDVGYNIVDFCNFLTQDLLEYVFQVGLEFNTTLDMPFQDDKRYYGMEMTLGYTFESIWNSGRDSSNGYAPEEGNDEINHYVEVEFRVFF